MSEKPILFSGEMVRAILDGRKTQTRRVVKDLPADFPHGIDCDVVVRQVGDFWCLPTSRGYKKSPYGGIGDLLWVRETHCIQQVKHGWRVGYYADDSSLEFSMGYVQWHDVAYSLNNYVKGTKRPSIFMPRWASRITLRVTGVRVERVQDITRPDIWAEGVMCEYCKKQQGDYCLCRNAFANLWNAINEKRGYGFDDVNPWVWAVEFERETAVSQPGSL